MPPPDDQINGLAAIVRRDAERIQALEQKAMVLEARVIELEGKMAFLIPAVRNISDRIGLVEAALARPAPAPPPGTPHARADVLPTGLAPPAGLT